MAVNRRKYDHGRILDLWAAGMTGEEVSAQVGCGRRVVNDVLRTARGAGDPRAGCRVPGPKMVLAPAQRVDLAAMWASGALLKVIGHRFGISEAAVTKYVKRMGLPLRRPRCCHSSRSEAA